MMSQFPLLDSLSGKIPVKDMSYTDKRTMIKNIIESDQEGKELIIALIYAFHNKNNKTKQETPYKGDIKKNNEHYDITWCLTDMPIKLRHILNKFISKHHERLKEEQDRNNAQTISCS